MPPGKVSEGILFGMGNPLLDISVIVGKDYLEKYGLTVNNAILAEDKHKPMYKELVQTFDVEYIAGGSTQNTIKVAQWMLQQPHSTTFVGCVGEDEYGEILQKKAEEIGVRTAYYKTPNESTGLCAALLCDNDRSLCANLAAANQYDVTHLKLEETWKLVEKAKYFYIAGFFLTVSPESIQSVAQHAAQDGKIFMMNLSAPFLCELFTQPMMDAIPYVDILFGNETEALAFARVHQFGTSDVTQIAKLIAGMPKMNKSRTRTVVITQGHQQTVVATGPDDVTAYPVIPLDDNQLVDTNGAGDAFVGGFLSQLVQERSVEKCVEGGHFAANLIIQRSGCTTPKECTFE